MHFGQEKIQKFMKLLEWGFLCDVLGYVVNELLFVELRIVVI